MEKFEGTFEELQELVNRAGYKGEWSTGNNGHHCFRASDGAVLNWWNTKRKTVSFQGTNQAKSRMVATLAAATLGGERPVVASDLFDHAKAATPPRTIFVVHGHDDVAREQLELILSKLGLDAFILQNTGGGGLTIIEALEKRIGKLGDMSFGIVLLTPDDVGYARKDGPDEAKSRARQNVILEMGMLIASFTRANVALVEKGEIEIPSDANGILRLRFQNHVKEIVPRLADRLKDAGFDIDAGKISRAAM